MARLDDNELNIHPEVAAALGYFRPEFLEEAAAPRRTEQSDVIENLFGDLREGIEGFVAILLWIFGAVAIFVAALLIFTILGWLYALFTMTPQQSQLGMSQAPRATVAQAQTHRLPLPARRQHVSAIRKINSAHSWDSMNSQRRRSPEAPRGVIPRNTINPRGGSFTRPLTKKENGHEPVPTQ